MIRPRPPKASRARPAANPPFPAAGVPLLGTLPDRELAARLGVSARAVARERARRRIAVRPGRRPRAGVRADVSRTVKLTPAEAAAQDAVAGDRPWATWAHDTLVAAAPSRGEQP